MGYSDGDFFFPKKSSSLAKRTSEGIRRCAYLHHLHKLAGMNSNSLLLPFPFFFTLVGLLFFRFRYIMLVNYKERPNIDGK